MQRFLREFPFPLQFGQRGGVGWRLVGVDDRWLFSDFQAVQCLPQKALHRRRVACRQEIEVDCVPVPVDDSVKVGPVAADLRMRLIDTAPH